MKIRPEIIVAHGDKVSTVTHRLCSPLWRCLVNNSVGGLGLFRSYRVQLQVVVTHTAICFNEVVPIESPVIQLPW